MKKILVLILVLAFATPCFAVLQSPKVAKKIITQKIFRDCPGCPKLVVIPSGSFEMGSPAAELGRKKDEEPLHLVNIVTFALGKTEITRGQFAAFVKETSYSTGNKCWSILNGKYEERSGNWQKFGYSQDDQHPVVCINWHDAIACGWT